MSKKFATGVILSVVTGRLCCRDFSKVHECIEHMAGGPVFTHQLPSWSREHQARINEAFPELAKYDVSGLNRETAATWLEERTEFLAAERDVPVIGDAPSSPFDGLEDKDVIVASV